MVACYDEYYNYLFTLPESSFFGEHNIMFGLYSELNYKAFKTKTQGECLNDDHKHTYGKVTIYKISA